VLLQSEIGAYWTYSILKRALRLDFVAKFGSLEERVEIDEKRLNLLGILGWARIYPTWSRGSVNVPWHPRTFAIAWARLLILGINHILFRTKSWRGAITWISAAAFISVHKQRWVRGATAEGTTSFRTCPADPDHQRRTRALAN
jgi:hypothetical protein